MMYEDMLNDLRNVVELRNIECLGTTIITLKEINRLKDFSKESGVQREKNKKHVGDIKESMLVQYIPPTITINKFGYIIDGQHTVQAARELLEDGKLSVDNKMVIIQFDTKGNKGDKELCRILNTSNKNWSHKDYLIAEASSGKRDYIWVEKFMEETGFSLFLTLELITGNSVGGRNNAKRTIKFKDGSFVATEEEKAIAKKLAEKIFEVRPYIPEKVFKQEGFKKAFAKIARHEKYNHKRMLQKLSYQNDRIMKCSCKKAYMELLQDIYNYKSRDKVNFLGK